MKLALSLLLLIVLQASAQNKHFLVFKFEPENTDSVLDWEYQTDEEGRLLWEKHADGEEILYTYQDGFIMSAFQCFDDDSCFTFRYIYEGNKEIYRYNIDQPAYFDSIPLKIMWRTEYQDSLTRNIYFKQESAERFNSSMHYRITRIAENKEEQIGFDENGKAFYFATKELDQFGPLKIDIAWIREGEGRLPYVSYKRYSVRKNE
jgi:hypothetical protein